jgi:hypothetical protein
MAKETRSAEIKLRTIGDLIDAGEWMFNRQQRGELDAKSADAMNTTLKGQSYLVAKLPMERAKLYVTARIKKIDLPPALFPAGMLMTGEE